MISASHARRFCIVLGMGIILILAASAIPGDDTRHACNLDLDAHDIAMPPSHLHGVDCAEDHTVPQTFPGLETSGAR